MVLVLAAGLGQFSKTYTVTERAQLSFRWSNPHACEQPRPIQAMAVTYPGRGIADLRMEHGLMVLHRCWQTNSAKFLLPVRWTVELERQIIDSNEKQLAGMFMDQQPQKAALMQTLAPVWSCGGILF